MMTVELLIVIKIDSLINVVCIGSHHHSGTVHRVMPIGRARAVQSLGILFSTEVLRPRLRASQFWSV